MKIETERLIIRPFYKDDWEELHTYTSDKNVMFYLPEDPFTEKGAKQFVSDNCGESAKHFAVTLKHTDKLIGHLSFYACFGEFTYEIGWVFHPSFYNQGYATEGASAMIAYAFQSMDVHRIIATCQPENPASYKIMEKIGMRREGHFKKCIPYKGEWWDEYYYAILREEYRVEL
ncbi:GNAT family N-acetyltransferase [Alkalicoccobacillus plakortidis]|uniref:GNAT family N-acetyltransferase n=1 Tax=Alkalicoccobacillus plakortidis TaxID=444060 RepID=A0ABT0XI18_9BACI|nr:GNAT family protein [Alkalicoccobacillus plakortidis]MCM2675534.1 GNAT family N-acetyltransferase [Alkalicoccobacillus plakortidis]